MLGEIRNALLLQRVHYGAGAVTTLDVVKMATENGARLLADAVARHFMATAPLDRNIDR